MRKIYFDETLIDENYYGGFEKTAELFTNTFKLGATICDSYRFTIDKSVISNREPSVVYLYDDDRLEKTLFIDNYKENDFTITYELTDSMVNFNFGYDALPVVGTEGATLLEILQDICEKAGVETNINSFDFDKMNITWYDNSITARSYLGFIAEINASYMYITADNKLAMKPYNKGIARNYNFDEIGKYKIGQKHKFSRVVLNNGINFLTAGDGTGDTYYINTDNVYVINQEVVDNIYNKIKDYEIYDVEVENLPDIKSNNVEFQIEGKAEQHSYSGKNYANINKDPDWKYGNTAWARSGSNVTVKNNGTSSYAFVEYYVDNLKPNTVYTVSMDAVANKNGYIRLSVGYPRDTGGVTSVRTLNTSGKQAHLTGQFTTPSDTSNLCVMLYSVTGTYKANAETTYSNIQIEEGSSETSYEPYVGGIPTPNPYYPEEIKTVSGIGNLFDINGEYTLAQATIEINNNTLIQTNVSAYCRSEWKIENLEVGKQYTLSYNFYNPNGSSIQGRVYASDNTTSISTSSATTNTSGIQQLSFTALTSTHYIKLYSNISGTSNTYTVEYNNIQLEEGTIVHTPVPYGHWLPVKVSNKNLFDESQLLEATNWVKNEDGYYTGTAYNLKQYSDAHPLTGFKENTRYTISSTSYSSISTSGGRFVVSYTDGTTDLKPLGQQTTATFVYSVTAKNKTVSSITFNYSKGHTLYIKDLQIEEGTTATDYIEHQEQTTLIDLNKYDENNNIVGNYELCSIGDIKDLLTIKDGKAVLNKNINNIVLDGNEDWTIGSQTYNNLYYFTTTSITDFKKGQAGVTLNIFKSPYFHYISKASNADLGGSYFINTMFLVFMNFTTIVDFKTWLSTHNTEVYYVLATPETIILRGTYDINLYEGVNHISIEDELEPDYVIVDDYELKAGDYVSITDTDNKIYKTIYQYSGINLSGNNWIGGLKNQIDTSKQEETEHINTKESIRRLKITIDRDANQIKQEIKETNSLTKEELNGKLDKMNENLTADINAKLDVSSFSSYTTSLETTLTSTEGRIEKIEKWDKEGISKVKTTSGTFNENGLTMEQTGAKTKGIFNQDGIDVQDAQGSSNEDLLFAGYVTSQRATSNTDLKGYEGQTVVYTRNNIVKNYLVIGKYSRMEDYEDGTGIFYIGG